MKKISRRSFLTAAALGTILAACGSKPASSTPASSGSTPAGSTPAGAVDPSSHKKFKIAILEVQLNDESTNRANWFKNYIAPRYNCEFIFSEAINTLDAAMTFIENAADSGCDAIINYYAFSANTQQLIELCRDKGMVLCENGGRNKMNEAAYVAGYENFGGAFMADQPDTGKKFYDYLKANLDTSKPHGFIIGTGAAYQGNAQQTEISSNMLTALEELYGLKFEKTKEELYQSDAPIEGKNDKGIEVYLYPGSPSAQGWLEGLNAAMQTKKYDYVMMAGNVIGNIMTTVGELEDSLGMDFTVLGFGTFGDALTSAMNAKDKFGNQALSMSTVKFTSIVSTMAFCETYNMLTGHGDVLKDADGNPNVLLFRMNAVTSPEQLAEMSSWDTEGKWVADYDFIDSVLADFTPGLTAEKIQENIYALDYDAIKARLG